MEWDKIWTYWQNVKWLLEDKNKIITNEDQHKIHDKYKKVLRHSYDWPIRQITNYLPPGPTNRIPHHILAAKPLLSMVKFVT